MTLFPAVCMARQEEWHNNISFHVNLKKFKEKIFLCKIISLSPFTITNVIETTPHKVMQKKGKVAESRRRSIMNQIYIVYSCNFINFRSMAFVMLFFFNFNNTQPTQHKDNLIYKFYNISKVIHHVNNL